MKKSSKLTIIFNLISLHFLCIPKMISSVDHCCKTLRCKGIEIKFPFRLKDRQPESCGAQGFDLYCDDNLGLLLELPQAGNFTVDNIFYYSTQIKLSDPNDCLLQKLLSLDLTTTRFYEVGEIENFSVYNCSGEVDEWYPLYHSFNNDKIDCLSGSDYTVRVARPNTTITYSNCTLLKIVPFPKYVYISYYDSYSSTYLTWDDNKQWCKQRDTSWVAPLASLTILAGLFLFWGCYFCGNWMSRRDTAQPAVTTTNTNHNVSHGQSSTPSNVSGLDQISISSYPTVVIGESGRLIKPGEDNCPICLSDYFPGETLKILPECLHRFHADCIDLWLSAKATCPICRTSPVHNS